MPNPQIQFPAPFTTASAIAYTNADGSVQLVTPETPIPVSSIGGGAAFTGLTDGQLRATPVDVNLPSFPGLTDSQMRAAPLSVTLSSFGGLTDAQLRATAINVAIPGFSGLTDTQLRASPLSVSIPGFSGLTDTQLRAAPVSVSLSAFGGITDTQLRASPVGTAPDAVADALRTSGSVTAVGNVVSVSTAGFSGGSFHVTSAGTTCTVTYEQSNDNVTWVALPVISLAAANATPALTTTAAGIYGYTTSAAWVRARVSTYTSGTVAITVAQKRVGAPATGVSLAGGASALGSVSVTGTATVAGTTNTGTGYTDSTAALAASATFTGTGRATTSFSQYAWFHAVAYADQSGTLYIDQSLDTGATYQPIASQAVTAATPAQLTARVTGAFAAATLYRVRFVNGATAQATFRLSSAFSR